MPSSRPPAHPPGERVLSPASSDPRPEQEQQASPASRTGLAQASSPANRSEHPFACVFGGVWANRGCDRGEGAAGALAKRTLAVDAAALTALLGGLPRLGPLRVVVYTPPPPRGSGWMPPPSWRILDPWLRILCGRAAGVFAQACVAPWGLREWIAVVSPRAQPLIEFELLPATDFCEWERLFQWLSARSAAAVGHTGVQTRAAASMVQGLRPRALRFVARAQAAVTAKGLWLSLFAEEGLTGHKARGSATARG